MIGEVEVDERERDASGQVYMTAAELMAEEVRRRGGEGPRVPGGCLAQPPPMPRVQQGERLGRMLLMGW